MAAEQYTNREAVLEAARKSLEDVLASNEPLAVYLSVRNETTGEVLYDVLGARGVEYMDTVTLTHIVGDVSITTE